MTATWIRAVLPIAACGISVAMAANVHGPRLQSPSKNLDRRERWSQDLDYFAAQFPKRHVDFARLYLQPAFDNEVAALKTAVPNLDDSEVTLRLMRLVARANVDHTYVYLPVLKLGFDQFPISFSWYADGLAVYETAPADAAALGARVLRIGSKTPDQLVEGLAPYIGHENDIFLRVRSRPFLAKVPVLKQLGALDPDGGVTLTVAKPGGQPYTVSIRPGIVRQTDMVSMYDAFHVPVTLYRKHMNSYYWYEYLPETQALYIQYNRCQNDPDLAFAGFAGGLFAFADSHAVQRVVIDLRLNGGGNSQVIDPLIHGLEARAALRAHLFALIGPLTFSSAQDAAIALRRKLRAILVGETTGEKPNGYGEIRELTLPNSQLTIQYSTKFFRMIANADPPALDPDVRAVATLQDALAGRDPVLEAALRQSGRQ